MSLKILIFPLFIILSLTIAIGYIKPDIETALAKRAEISLKKSDLAKVDTVVQNIQRLHAAVDERGESESFVLKYLPQTLEEERVLDTFNFLASQSGVLITAAAVKENSPIEKEIPQVQYASSSFQALADAQALAQANAAGVPLLPPTKTIRSYAASVTVLGAYANLKDFFTRLAATDRMHNTRTYSIEVRTEDEEVAEEEKKYPADFLRGKFEADFIHFSPSRISSALNLPLFQEGKFDFSTVDSLLTLVNSPLPPLEVGATGKPNPFQ